MNFESVNTKKIKAAKWIIAALILVWIFMPLPNIKPAYSKVLYSKEGILLSATISGQQQWCFPLDEDIPEALSQCIIAYEDEYLAFHPGINPVSIFKALLTNIKARKVVRGASTIPMQVMRIRNKNASRNWYNKIKESLAAVKYSLITRDKTILREWCEIAPFGGNTIGVKAASLRYFGRPIDKLSWAEYALLAVMPNGPSSANLTKNRAILEQKRNFLLKKLHSQGYFDASELELYLGEELPTETKAIPQIAYHSLLFMVKKYPNKNIFRSTIPYELQLRTQDLIERESSFLKMDDIRNLAAVVVDIQSNELLAYHGNVKNSEGGFSYVDIAQAPRSYGSLLKPLLYAHALETAQFLPNEMIPDIPTSIGDFQPENFDKKYRGVVPFEEMLIQSLNVPSVRVLNSVGLQGFNDLIKNLNIAYLNKGAEHYGLSIILGGGESSLWDMSRLYKGFAQNYLGNTNPFREVQTLSDLPIDDTKNAFSFSAYSMYHLVKAMSDLTRPREEKSWDFYDTNYKIAWKTGTSYGHKDGWAIGFSGKYMVGIWIGNEGGEGRFDLTGITKAAPVMFKIFNVLPKNIWFSKNPVYSKKEIISICGESGKLAGPLCKKKQKLITEHTSFKYQPCNYHKEIWFNHEGQALDENCQVNSVRKDTLFILPSFIEYYYKSAHRAYKGLPAYDISCLPQTSAACKIIYPYDDLKIFLPKEKIDSQNELVIKAYHRDKSAKLYWFLDDTFFKITNGITHELLVKVGIGKHILTINDQWGNADRVAFEVLGRD